MDLAYNEKKDAKETASCKQILVVIKLYNMVFNYLYAKKYVHNSWAVVETELAVNRTQYKSIRIVVLFFMKRF